METLMETLIISLHLQTAVFYSLIAITTTLVTLYIYMENTRMVRLGNKLPGPKTVPFFGNLLIVLRLQPNEIVEELLKHDIYGPVIRVFVGHKLLVALYHPRDVELILNSTEHIDKSPEYRFFKPWLGDGLLISTGEKWRSHRKIIAPTFHLNILKTFVPLFYENSRDLVIRLRDQVGKEFDCHDYLAAVTVDILLDTAMGVRESEKHKDGYNYAMAVMKMCDIIHRRTYNAVLRVDFLFKFSQYAKEQLNSLNVIHSLTSRVIKKKKEDIYKKICSNIEDKQTEKSKKTTASAKSDTNISDQHKGGQQYYVRDDLDEIDENDVGEKKRLAFLDLLLELSKNGAKLTDQEIQEEVDTIMFEGHDTTAAGSSFTLCLLGIHQDVQERVYEELKEIFGESNRPCTFQDTLEMKYLERVIFESLRLYSPVPAIARKIKEDIRIVTGNYLIPKGTTILIPQFRVHRLEEFYPNPNVFNPDNFLPEKMQSRHYYSFIPFSAGPRSCVGRKYAMLKLKVLLSTILRNYKILSDLTEKDFRLRVDIILKREDGFRIKIEPRNKNN
ncbi:cytochrome P450 4g15-like [Frieseomelitta varia]|uniref:cytochrome P450 4g15-like n=1 Tax=Frieseomelitta varia TaxID=561572 RepID=UPI001CB6AA81|nr:cytochrome P450 4g15-like [Frieseomelitta varia]